MTLTTREQVRLLIGDVDATDYALTDAQVDWLLSEYADDARATAPEAAQTAANVLTMRAVDQSTGSMSVTYSARAALYRQRAIDLGGAATVGKKAGIYIGGVDSADLPGPYFSVDLHDIEVDDGLTSEDDAG